MMDIKIYDSNYTDIEKLSEKFDVTKAEVIEALLYVIEDQKIDISEYFE